MIKSFANKGLNDLFNKGIKKGIQAKHKEKIEDILTHLNEAEEPEDMDVPRFKLHKLIGTLAGFWAVKVSRSWRIIFTFDGKDADQVDYTNYH